ncbi:hypothetical protein GCM10020000_26210 [Streptomyces olivoverticillatus]
MYGSKSQYGRTRWRAETVWGGVLGAQGAGEALEGVLLDLARLLVLAQAP